MKGLFIALSVMVLWATNLLYCLSAPLFATPLPVLILLGLVQVHLYTGLFITAHDSIHRTVHKNSQVNYAVGAVASLLYAGLWYPNLQKNHYLHHAHPGTADDPDFYRDGKSFFKWFFSFMYKYTTVSQLIFMAVAFNLLIIVFNQANVVIFWMIPAILSTVQLFYFGTYMPHKLPHNHSMLPHNARSLRTHHLWAFISCYFFGYHFEHHAKPHIPWWGLYRVNEEFNEKNKRTPNS